MRFFSRKKKTERTSVTSEADSITQEQLNEEKQDMIQGVEELSSTTVKEVMIPRIDTDFISSDVTQEELMDIIRLIREKFNVPVLLIEHDMKFVSGLCDEVTVLNFGTTLAQGETKTVLQDPEVVKAYIGG